MDLTHDPNDAALELAQIIAASPEWQRVKDEIVALAKRGTGHEQLIAEARAALKREGLGGETILGSIPDEYASRLTAEERDAVVKLADLLILASIISDIQTGEPLPFMSMALGGATTEEYVTDEGTFRIVRAMATPLDSPERVIAEFAEACFAAFDAETYARYPNRARDATWWRRHESGETYRQIAYDDPRSGLAPEALATPEEYGDEITRATDAVRRAVRRFKARWTRKADLLSKKPG